MKIKALFLALILCLSIFSHAQKYEVSLSIEPYIELEGDSIVNPRNFPWQGYNYFKVPIGFTHPYFGNESGFLEVEMGYAYFNYTLDTAIYIFGGVELWDRGVSSPTMKSESPISFVLEGTEGNRILKIQWKNVGFRKESPSTTQPVTTYYANAQLWLYESGGFELRYGPSFVPDIDKAFAGIWPGPIIGYSFDAEIEYDLCGPASAPTLTELTKSTACGITGMPQNGRVYRFSIPTAIEDSPQKEGSLKIYPIPANQSFAFESPEAGLLEVYSCDAKLQHREIIATAGNNQIDINHLSSGIYIVKFNAENGSVYTARLVKQ